MLVNLELVLTVELLEGKHAAAACVNQQLEADAQRLGTLCLLAERFMVIQQAMGAPSNYRAIRLTASPIR